MSGAYNSGSYEIFVPQTQKGKYNKYATEIVAIVSISRDNKGNVKAAKLYFTEKVDKIMNHPPFVMLGLSGSNVGIIPMDNNNEGKCYAVSRKKGETDSIGMAFVNMTAFAKYINLEEGVYSAHVEPNKVIEFNRKSKPSQA